MTRWLQSVPSVSIVERSASRRSDRDRRWPGFALAWRQLTPTLQTVCEWWTNERRVDRSRSARCLPGKRQRGQRVPPESSPIRFCVLESSFRDKSAQRWRRDRSCHQRMCDSTSTASSSRATSTQRSSTLAAHNNTPVSSPTTQSGEDYPHIYTSVLGSALKNALVADGLRLQSDSGVISCDTSNMKE
jgi:hypothetical protein